MISSCDPAVTVMVIVIVITSAAKGASMSILFYSIIFYCYHCGRSKSWRGREYC